jgi:hypothetical protein
MKKTIVAFMVIMLTGTISSFAQGDGQRPTPEERVKRAHAKLDSAFKLDETKLKQIDALYLDYYQKQDKVREEVRANGGGGGGGSVMQEKMKPFTDELDGKLKPILGDDNFKIWKEQVEPTLRRRGGPPRQ